VLDNFVLDKILAREDYTSLQHMLFPCQLIPAELLESAKFTDDCLPQILHGLI
jgi:hypothetical protein